MTENNELAVETLNVFRKIMFSFGGKINLCYCPKMCGER